MKVRFAIAALVAAVVCVPARADVKVPGLFSDGMVLQQGAECKIWGTAEANENVTVELNLGKGGVAVGAAADKDGKWVAKLPAQKAGGPYTLTIQGKNKIALKDVYVGEVWVCSGQSNMEMRLDKCADGAKHVKESQNPKIRLFTVPRARPKEPQTDLNAKWVECGPNSVPGFSGVAYFFGRDLQKALDVPVGLIHTSVGGTASEEWTSMKVLDANPDHKGKSNNQATLYNGMIAPLIPYTIKGAIWYQGESNAGRAELYRTGFPLMIKNWRDDWGQGDFPFLFVQLAPYEKAGGDWPRLREAQLMSLKVPNTAMAVITDVGEKNDIHPPRKEPVGARLALAARAVAYKEKIEYSGPMYEKLTIDGDKAVLSFTHVGKGLECKGEALTGFQVAGEDKTFHDAKAEIKGDKIVVTCDKVAKPAAVRFGWNKYPDVNFWNKDGLPASPFRTDDWK
jgi:sialate O-acetylesterase